MSQQAAQTFVAHYKPDIDALIIQELSKRAIDAHAVSPHLSPILTAMQELSVGGKRLRAILVLLGYRLAGNEINAEVLQAAVAIELFHLGLLIQDDFMDLDTVRRGVPTVNARFPDRHIGNSMAMLAGDYTFGWAIELLSDLSLPPERVVAAMAVWGKYFTRVGYGQTLDGLDVADEESILQILSIKSGEYSCVLPLLLGATLGGADSSLLNRLEQYGMELGHVFQLRDDWLGMYGDSAKTGKPSGEQAKKGKKTFATLYGQDKTEAAIEAHMKQGMELAGDDAILLGLIGWVGTRQN